MPHSIAFLVFPGFQLLDLAGPISAFEYAEHYRPGSYRWKVIAALPGPVASSCGAQVVAQPLPAGPRMQTLVVSGGFGVNDACEHEQTIEWVRRAALPGVRLASVCSGSMLLAASGLLDGRHATTHWARTKEFLQRFPAVKLDADRIYVQDGDIWTSAGITAGIDLALALIAADHGEPLARKVAKMLVVNLRRPGGDSQFSALLETSQRDDRFAALLDYVRSHPRERHSVPDLASRVGMQVRHFVRVFTAVTGTPPSKAVERIRVDAARLALENRAGSVEEVAQASGFGHVERMRRSFLRQLGMPPAVIRGSRRTC